MYPLFLIRLLNYCEDKLNWIELRAIGHIAYKVDCHVSQRSVGLPADMPGGIITKKDERSWIIVEIFDGIDKLFRIDGTFVN